MLISYKKVDFSCKDPKSDLKTACWKVQSDILINRKTAGCSQTLPDRLIWFFIWRLRSSNCSSVAYMWSSQRKGFTWASPLLLSSLTVSPFFPGHSFLFFPSLFFQSCAQWPSSFCLRCPSASPRSIFILSVSQRFSSICLRVELFLFLLLHRILYQETSRGAILKPRHSTFSFFYAGAAGSKTIFKFQKAIQWEGKLIILCLRSRKPPPVFIMKRGNHLCYFSKLKFVFSHKPNAELRPSTCQVVLNMITFSQRFWICFVFHHDLFSM